MHEDHSSYVCKMLVYYRMYITYTLAGFLFNIDQSNVCRDIQKIEPLVRQCLPIPQKLYKITKKLKTAEDVENFSQASGIIDVTEQQIQKTQRQKKKKNVTIQIKESGIS